MTILKESNKVDEYVDVKNLDKVRKIGALSGWQKQIYNLINIRLAGTVFDRMMDKVYKIAPEGANPEDIKNALVVSFLDYIDSIS